MTPNPDDAKARLDKALADMKMLQEKLRNLSPEQREKLAEKLRANAPQLIELKARLEAAASMFESRRKSLPDQIAGRLASGSPYVAAIRKMKNKAVLVDEWGNGYLIPPSAISRRASLRSGKGIAKFWAETIARRPEKEPFLAPVAAAWSTAPTLVLPTLATQIGGLVTQAAQDSENQVAIPWETVAEIVGRMVVEVQLQSGIDPAVTESLDEVLQALSAAASGNQVHGEPKQLALKAMLLYAWLEAGLPASTANP